MSDIDYILFSEDEITFFIGIIRSELRDLKSEVDGIRIVSLRRRLESYFRSKRHFDKLMLILNERNHVRLMKGIKFVSAEDKWSGVSHGEDTYLFFKVVDL